MAEVSATEPLIQRLNPRVFRIGIVVLSNNAQVLCMGERVVGLELAKELVKVWLDLEFDPESSSAAKVDAICAYDGSLEQA